MTATDQMNGMSTDEWSRWYASGSRPTRGRREIYRRQRMVIRAKIVLAAADGHQTRRSRGYGLGEDTVRTWRGRWHRTRVASLGDAKRSGRPPMFTAAQVARVKAIACTTRRRSLPCTQQPDTIAPTAMDVHSHVTPAHWRCHGLLCGNVLYNGDIPTRRQADPMLDDLAQMLLEKLDVLLDRLTDRALQSPRAGSAPWHSDWLDRNTDDGRDLERRRVLTRISLARRAGLSPGRDVATARSLGVTDAALQAGGVSARPRARYRPRHHRDQLAMFEL